MALLQYQRESLVRKVAGLADEPARRPLVPTGTSLVWLMKHMARAEAVWVRQRFVGETAPVLDDSVGPEDTVFAATDAYRAGWSALDQVVATHPLDEPCHGLADGEPPTNLRWVLMHLLEETARHAGHADILRELIDGTTGR